MFGRKSNSLAMKVEERLHQGSRRITSGKNAPHDRRIYLETLKYIHELMEDFEPEDLCKGVDKYLKIHLPDY